MVAPSSDFPKSSRGLCLPVLLYASHKRDVQKAFLKHSLAATKHWHFVREAPRTPRAFSSADLIACWDFWQLQPAPATRVHACSSRKFLWRPFRKRKAQLIRTLHRENNKIAWTLKFPAWNRVSKTFHPFTRPQTFSRTLIGRCGWSTEKCQVAGRCWSWTEME